MGFSGLFSIGVSGLTAYSTGLEAVSNNIANSQTVGYRQARTDFSQLVGQQIARNFPGSSGDGVSARNRTVQIDQGQITRTQTATNLAIAGNGYFVVSPTADGAEQHFTRAGDFRVNEAGNLVNGSGQILLGTPAAASQPGSIGSLIGLQPISLSEFTGRAAASTGIFVNGTLPSTGVLNPAASTYDPANPLNNLAAGNIIADRQQSVTIFDADGNTQQLTIAFLRLSDNQIAVEAFRIGATDGQPVASGILSFASDGSLDAAQSTVPQTIAVGGNFPAIEWDISNLRQTNGNTRQISNDLSVAQQGGAPFGNVTGYAIDQNGALRATLSNGLEELLFQIPLASFTNPEGLARVSDTSFRFDPNAGALELSRAGQSANGLIESNAVENSTVDITQAFSTLIETQRAYSANAQILSVANELYQALNTTAR